MGWLLAQEWVEAWLRAMSRASLYGSLAITGGWLICRWLPRMSPAAKSWVWRVVYLKLSLLVLWPGTIPVPLLPSPGVRIERAQAPAQVSSAVRESSAASRGPSPGAGKSLPGESGPAAARFATVAGFGIWLSGVFLVAILTIRNTCATRKALRASRSLTDPRVHEECEALSRDQGLRRSPQLLCSNSVSGPQAVGVRRPVLLFPSSFVDRFSAHEIRLVLAHELAHIQRRDLLWGWLRRVMNGLLFFHPLVWVAHEQATLAEEIACDETAFRRVNATVPEYARTLLRVTEQSLLIPVGVPALLGTGMSRAYRAIARRLQALQQIRNFPCKIARSRRRRAAVMGCLAVLALLPWGLLTWFHSSGIRQIDPRYPVLGFKVSRGRNHTLSVRREACRIAGLTMSRAVEDAEQTQPLELGGSGARSSAVWTSNPTDPRGGMPARVAGWLRKLGLKPRLATGRYTAGVYLAEESCAVIVRFAHNPEFSGYADIAAFLVDDHGETIPLAPYRTEFPAQSGECVKFWVVSPAPVTRSKFDLRLKLATEGKDVAVLCLGEL